MPSFPFGVRSGQHLAKMAEGMQSEEIALCKSNVGIMWHASNVVASNASSLSSKSIDYMVEYMGWLTNIACFPDWHMLGS